MTIRDIAGLAGVSEATVSRVINHSALVSDDVRGNVLAIMEENDYKPSRKKRPRQVETTRTVLAVVSNIENNFNAIILQGIIETMERVGYSVLICDTNYSRALERNYLALLKKGVADGVICLHSDLSDAELLDLSRQYPLVQCYEYRDKLDIPWVSIDNIAASHTAIGHLTKIGCKNIAMLSCEKDLISKRQRESVFIEIMRQRGVAQSDILLARSDQFSLKGGLRTMKHLLSLNAGIDGIVAISDLLAIGAINEIMNAGLRVPGDIAVVGFDDISISSIYRPSLTTISQPQYDLGVMSADMLIKLMHRENNFTRNVVLEHELRIRESTLN